MTISVIKWNSTTWKMKTCKSIKRNKINVRKTAENELLQVLVGQQKLLITFDELRNTDFKLKKPPFQDQPVSKPKMTNIQEF